MTRVAAIPDDSGRVTRDALIQFVGRCVLALLIVGLATFGVASRMASQEALHDAEVRGETFTLGIAAPLVNERLREGRPAAVRRFDSVMRNGLSLGTISHIKVWDPDGTVIWADDSRITGQRFPMPRTVAEQPDDTFTVGWTAPVGEVDDATDRSNLEIYVGTHDADGKPVILESYWTAHAIDSRYELILKRLAPLSLGALLLLMVAIVPLGVSLARRLGRSTRERDRMLQHALRASDLERRRMTQTLHDGVLQDLAGLSYALSSATPREPRNVEEAALRTTLLEATDLIKSDVRRLREILADVYPPSLEQDGLDAALLELADWAGRSGIDVTISAHGTEHLEAAYARLAYRVVREGLMNVITHSGARHALVWVRVTPTSGVEIAVRDDGQGSKPQAAVKATGHFGLRILRDVMAELGGDLTVRRATAEGGTELHASLPDAHAEDRHRDPADELVSS